MSIFLYGKLIIYIGRSMIVPYLVRVNWGYKNYTKMDIKMKGKSVRISKMS